MNPNQPPNYPPGQYPAYPPMYPGMPPTPQPPQHPQYMQGTPQYPQPQPAFMNVQIKPEPMWSQDARYGMPSVTPVPPNMPQYPPQMAPMTPMAPMHTMPGMEMGGRADAPVMYSIAPAPVPYSTFMHQQQPMHTNPGNSLLAQHLAAAPVPPPQHQQPSQLHQLLQQPVYPNQALQGGPASQQSMQQQQQMHAEQQRQMQMQAQMRQQQQQQQYQADSVPPPQHKSSYLDPTSHAFPPSASSTHSVYSRMAQFQEQHSVSMLSQPPTRPTPATIEDFEKMTTGELCVFGRELVTDLNSKTSQLSQMLKRVMERKTLNQGENPNELSDQCKGNLEKISDIRQVIEKRRPAEWKRISGDDYLTLMLEDEELDEDQKKRREELEKRMPAYRSESAPNEGDVWYDGRWVTAQLHQKYVTFEENKKKLIDLSNQLKTVSWKIEVTSPGHLKKVDQTKISKKREDLTP